MADSEPESAKFVTVASLLRTVGKIGRPSGRGLFMFRALTTSTLSAAFVGLCSATIGGVLLLGGGQFFLVTLPWLPQSMFDTCSLTVRQLGSCVGFIGGNIIFYKIQVREAFMALDEFPELMRLHLMLNFPAVRWSRMKMDRQSQLQERLRIQQSWALTSMLASAYQTASSSIDEVQMRREQTLIDNLSKTLEASPTASEEWSS